MCQTNVYLKEGDQEREILKDVILIEPVDDGVKIQSFLSGPKIIPARIAVIDLLKHRIILKPSA